MSGYSSREAVRFGVFGAVPRDSARSAGYSPVEAIEAHYQHRPFPISDASILAKGFAFGK